MRYAWKLMLLCVCLLLGASVSFGQTGGAPNFSAEEDHGTDSIDLTTLLPTFHFQVTGAITLQAPQGCHWTGTLQNGNWICSYDQYSTTYPMAALSPTLSTQPMGKTPSISDWSTDSNNCTTITMVGVLDSNSSTLHPFTANAQGVYPSAYYPSTCGNTSVTATTNDSSGLTATLSLTNASTPVFSVYNSSGANETVTGTWYFSPDDGSYTVTDVFGNAETWTGTGGAYTNQLGAVITLGGSFPVPPTSYTYTDPSPHSQQITFTTGTTMFKNFIPAGNLNCPQMVFPTTAHPITAINYPDGTSVGIGWEPNGTGNSSGLINSVTLRTGGTISYVYGAPQTDSNCDYFYTSLKRMTVDGSTNYNLNYNVQNNTTTTTVVDNGSNKTVYTFIGTRYGLGLPPYLQSVYRYKNTGSPSSPTYTLVSSTCYGYNTGSCTTTTGPVPPITQRDTYEYVYANGTTQEQMSHRVELLDSTYGLVTSDALTDSTGSGETQTITYVYGTYSGTYPNGSCVALGNTKIHDHVCTITTKVGSTQTAQKANAYNSNGALTSSTQWLSGSSPITTTYSPNTNGTIASMTNPNGQVTNYTYGNCNGLLLTDSTTTVNSVVIDSKKTWNCDGAVGVDSTDPNGLEDDTTYDSMFRPLTYTDQNEQVTSYAYGTNYIKVTDPAGVISYQYADGLGRPTVNQICETSACSSLDTTSKSRAWNGTDLETKSSVPCVQTVLNTPCTTVALTADVNPIAGPTKSTDVNGGTVTYGIAFSSSGRGASVTTGPKPSSDNSVKTIQTFGDGFGRNKSVCALETSGGGACGDAFGNSGILTTSTYSVPAAGQSEVQITRGSQTHTAYSDALGRTTSITTPEAGTVTNYYDSVSGTTCASAPPAFAGALVAVKDNAGQYVCYWRDGLGRVTDTGNTYQNSTQPCKRFRYDSTSHAIYGPPSGYPSSGANIIGRMAEAATDGCNPNTELTDEWFAYDKLGRVTDLWEWTVNSGGYYHMTVAYNNDGVITSISGIPGLSALTIGVDGESRPFNAQLGSAWIVGKSSTTGVSYDAGGESLGSVFGTSGNVSTNFTYDNLEQMKTWQHIALQSPHGAMAQQKGTLTWNGNGSLASLGIVDGFNNPSNNQTCSYSYDDVARLITDNCGSSIWNQTYSYDQYDNLTKAGNPGISFNPGYNANNNEFQNGSTYDSNGFITYDLVNTYTSTVYGQMASFAAGHTAASCGSTGVCLTYDAMGRLVERNAGGTINQFLLAPALGRVAKMTGQTLVAAYIPLPGGADLWASTTNTYVAFPDWLGTKRLAIDLSSQTDVMSTAFSPYGDSYASTGSTYKGDFIGLQQDVQGQQFFDTPNRELNQTSARFQSVDPNRGSSWNGYAYPPDPNRQTDRTGLCDEDYSSGCVDANSDQGTNTYGPVSNCPAGDACDAKANDPCTEAGILEPCGANIKIEVDEPFLKDNNKGVIISAIAIPPGGYMGIKKRDIEIVIRLSSQVVRSGDPFTHAEYRAISRVTGVRIEELKAFRANRFSGAYTESLFANAARLRQMYDDGLPIEVIQAALGGLDPQGVVGANILGAGLLDKFLPGMGAMTVDSILAIPAAVTTWFMFEGTTANSGQDTTNDRHMEINGRIIDIDYYPTDFGALGTLHSCTVANLCGRQ